MKVLFTTLLILMSSMAYGNQKAITDTGDKVILYSDGTWEYEEKADHKKGNSKSNSRSYRKSPDSTFLVKSTENNAGFWLDTDLWEYEKATTNDDAEYEFKLKGEFLWAIAINETNQMSVEKLVDIAFDNAKSVAPDVKVVQKEYRTVNGSTVIYMEMVGTIEGTAFKYFGYYHSDESGTTQFLAFTDTEGSEFYQEEINDLLNGFTVR
ncbi:MAG: hypothetical protein OEY19_10550 [Gammaproteobacteria bacterium]|nr:hypothetical protein [Gammaproteobacteria bacterium]